MPNFGIATRMAAHLRSFVFPALGGNRMYGGFTGGLMDLLSGGVLPGSSYDYRKEAGVLWENSIVAACVQWIVDSWAEAQLVVEEPDENGKYHAVPNHPLISFLDAPNPDYDGSVLMGGLLLSYFCDGNAYAYIDRAASGKAVGLYYIPHWMIQPRWGESGSTYISDYEYMVDGKSILFAPENIIHIRNGAPDPANIRKGISRLKAQLREICTDNECATLVAALLRNNGIPGVVIGPAAMKDDAGNTFTMGKTARDKLVETWTEKFGGDRRGEPFVTAAPISVTPLSFNPQQLVVDKIRAIPEARICAAFGLPPQVVGLSVGLEHGTYNNYQVGVQIAYQRALKPAGKRIARALTHALIDEPGFDFDSSSGRRLGYDYSEVSALQPDKKLVTETAGQAFQDGLLSLNEARAEIGHDEAVIDGDRHIWAFTGAGNQDSAQAGKLKPKPAQQNDDSTEAEDDDE